MEQKCQAHNLKIVGSNPTPQPTYYTKPITYKDFKNLSFWGFQNYVLCRIHKLHDLEIFF